MLLADHHYHLKLVAGIKTKTTCDFFFAGTIPSRSSSSTVVMLPHPDGDSDEGVPQLTGGACDAVPEDNDKDLDLEDDNNEDDEDDELKWNSGMSKCKDLFSDAEFDSAQECLDQCQAQHNFDIKVNSGHVISTTRNTST